jgi:hypothetical protein
MWILMNHRHHSLLYHHLPGAKLHMRTPHQQNGIGMLPMILSFPVTTTVLSWAPNLMVRLSMLTCTSTFLSPVHSASISLPQMKLNPGIKSLIHSISADIIDHWPPSFHNPSESKGAAMEDLVLVNVHAFFTQVFQPRLQSEINTARNRSLKAGVPVSSLSWMLTTFQESPALALQRLLQVSN